MTWTLETSRGDETAKCRPRLARFCRGVGLDLGPGDEKITTNAVGVGLLGKAVEWHTDLTRPDALRIWADESMDFVYSSHCLEDMADTQSALRSWWRKLKPGGHLVLYLPHRDLYPNVGQPGANPNHKHDFVPEDILRALQGAATFQVVANEVHGEEDEYSFDLVLRKLPGDLGEIPLRKSPPPRNRKRACVVRYGTYGDQLMASVLAPLIQDLGYSVVWNTIPKGEEILRYDPHIDEFLVQDENQVHPDDLDDYWARMKKGFDLFVNLSGSVEEELLFREGIDKGYTLDKVEREKQTAHNYVAYQVGRLQKEIPVPLGYIRPDQMVPQFYLGPEERFVARHIRSQSEGKFLVGWVLAGSAHHKRYPWAEKAASMFLSRHPDARVLAVGGADARPYAWTGPQTVNRVGIWGIRDSATALQAADCVVGPETGLMQAVAGAESRKIVMLSHSSRWNLTAYWLNTVTVSSASPCQPCHQLHYTLESCPLSKNTPTGMEAPVCVADLPPERISEELENAYQEWRNHEGIDKGFQRGPAGEDAAQEDRADQRVGSAS